MKTDYIYTGPILAYLYRLNGGKYYWDDINVSASSETFHTDTIYIAKYAFDFKPNSHWTPEGSTVNATLTICFNHYEVSLTNYSITPPSVGERMGTRWSFAGSLNNITYYDEEEYKYNLTAGETHSENWSHGPYRCLRLTVLDKSNGHNDYKFDINQMEFEGSIRRIFGGICTKICVFKFNMLPYIMIFLL